MFKLWRGRRRRPVTRPVRRSSPLRLEALDDRVVPAAVGVVRNGGTIAITGGAGDDTAVVTQSGQNVVVDLNGTTTTFARGQVRAITFRGGDGNDTFINNTDIPAAAFGGSGDDVLSGGSGRDDLRGDAGDDLIDGGAGNDACRGGRGDDEIEGGADRDRVDGEDGVDRCRGGAGDDQLFGGGGDDDLDGDEDNDQLHGGRGNDRLRGGDGDDRINGESGDDDCDGGRGRDSIAGGSGRNTSLSDPDDRRDDCGRNRGRRRGDGRAEAEGTITAIDADAGEVTIRTFSGATVTVTVTDATVFEKDGAHVTLAAFAVGDVVEAKFNPDTLVAGKIESGDEDDDNGGGQGGNRREAKIEGTITAVGDDRVTIRTRGGREVTVTVNARTKIERNDRHVTLAAFQVGDFGEARYDAATLVATKVEAEGA